MVYYFIFILNIKEKLPGVKIPKKTYFLAKTDDFVQRAY